MRVLAASSDAHSLITQIRVTTPLQALLTCAADRLHADSYPYIRLADLADADVLVAQRPMSARQLRLMQAMRAKGRAVICEIDDLLTASAPYLVHHAAIERARPWVLRCLAAAHVVTTSTPRLAAALAPYASAIEIVPNHGHPLAEAALPLPQPGAPATVLLATSDRLAATALYPALHELVATRGAALQIVGVGGAAADAAAAGLPVQSHPMLPREAFVALASALPNVVAAIPLDDSPFSNCKSAIKWFDYAEAGIPTLTSKLPPYADVIDDRRTGLLVANTTAAWHAALCHALDDECWRLEVAQAARAQVRAHHHAGLTQAAWQRALERALALSGVGSARAPWWAGWRDHLVGPVDNALVGLRRINRQRLEQRRLRRQAAAPG